MPKDTPSDVVRLIDDYLKGRLNQSQIDHLWVLLMQNPEYYPLLETQAAMKRMDVEEIRRKLENKDDDGSTDDQEPYSGFVNESKTPWVSALAAVVIIAVLLNIFRSPVETEIRPLIDEIHTTNLIAPDISRSTATEMSNFEQALYRAYLLSLSGNAKGAIAEYEQLLDYNDIKRNWVDYNLAIIYYNTGQHLNSAELFQTVDCEQLDGNVRVESCYWFMTNSFLAVNNLERARESAEIILQKGSIYQHDAIDLVRKIQYFQEK